ncbi:hypothetical protein T261_7050 [Streptomyces lydicus]|nr:hypothetical protein T261_7050 [Streptomyces lydicus]
MTNTCEPPRPDYRIDGFEAATEQTEDDFHSVTLSDDMLVPLAEHHSADDRDTYLLLYDRAATWAIPGTAEYVTLHINRDTEQRTFGFAHERHPVIPLAQNWLIRQGCPAESTEPNHGPRPADALTTRLEGLLRTNPDSRYEVIDHYTDNPYSPYTGSEVRTLVHDSHPDSAMAPYRLFLEETTTDHQSYAVREGAFSTAQAAKTWAWSGPLRSRWLPTRCARLSAGQSLLALARRSRPTASPCPRAAVATPRSAAAAPSRVRRSAP